ncbi:MAG: hypothetical protein MN733_20040 [Nitrososphaera sp.]|nr:hypothetical protein [Nitrososphaera sp.]
MPAAKVKDNLETIECEGRGPFGPAVAINLAHLVIVRLLGLLENNVYIGKVKAARCLAERSRSFFT